MMDDVTGANKEGSAPSKPSTELWVPPQWTNPRKRSRRHWGPPKWTGFQGKTLWDWFQLFVISVALTGLGFWFTQANQRHDEQVSADRNRDTTLREYLDTMSDLLLNKGLAASKEDDPVRVLARARTLTVLSTLKGDGVRKGSIVQF